MSDQRRTQLIRKAYAIKNSFGLSDAEFDDLKLSAGGVSRIRDMDMICLGNFVRTLQALQSNRRRLSDGQRRKILKLMYILEWEPVWLNAYLHRQTGKVKLEWLTPKEAYDIIEAMSAMIERGVKYGQHKQYKSSTRHKKQKT